VVGLGAPPEASSKENEMRYLVLATAAIAEMGGFLAARAALSESGERFYGATVLAAMLLAGPLYLVWDTLAFGKFFTIEHLGQKPAVFDSLSEALSVLLDIAELLTYLATAMLALSLTRVRWLGRSASRVFVTLSIIAWLLLVNSEMTPRAPTEPFAWYNLPSCIVGIPGFPLIMPSLLAVVLLRRAGEAQL
jgi:hypothetical protein